MFASIGNVNPMQREFEDLQNLAQILQSPNSLSSIIFKFLFSFVLIRKNMLKSGLVKKIYKSLELRHSSHSHSISRVHLPIDFGDMWCHNKCTINVLL